jgi:hypothetical protein
VEGGSRFIGAKNFFSSLSGMTEAGSNNDDDYFEEYNDEPNQVTKYVILYNWVKYLATYYKLIMKINTYVNIFN